MKQNKRSYRGGMFSLVETLIVIAVLGLVAAISTPNASAQQRLRPFVLHNTAIGTAYDLLGGTQQNQGEGVYVYTGGTNSVTLTNAQSIYAPTTAVPFSLAPLQNVPVWWNLAATAAGTGTSNTVVGLDLSADGVYWTSNSITATIAQTGTGTNIALVYFPLNNGTNVFSGWSQARWSYASTAQTNNVTLLANQLQVVR